MIGCAKKEAIHSVTLSRDNIDGEILWLRISEEAVYSRYPFWPNHEGIRPGQSPHGSYHRVFINTVLLEALPAANRQAPDGAIIVKDNLDASKQLSSITVMAKIKGYNPEHGDWFWAKYGPTGTIQAQGKVYGCIKCHEGNIGNDFIIIQRLDAALKE